MKSGDNTMKIEQSDSEKDIGVTFDSNMKFNIHISNIVKKANQRLGLIRRTFDNLDKSMFLLLYKSLVRPNFEYATVIWSPWLKNGFSPNRKCPTTRQVKEIQHLSYEDRLKALRLLTVSTVLSTVETEWTCYKYSR